MLLDRLHDILAADAVIAKAIPFSVSRKGARRAQLHQAILSYRRPDFETCQTLAHYHKDWLSVPQRFWDGRETDTFQFQHLSPEAQIVGRYLNLRRSDV